MGQVMWARLCLRVASALACLCAEMGCDQDSQSSSVGPDVSFLDGLERLLRRLSGLLILLLLFLLGYFIQRITCPRPRPSPDEEPALLNTHALQSQDSLTGDFSSPVLLLPAYEEVKHLPSYEEILMEDSAEHLNTHTAAVEQRRALNTARRARYSL